MGTQFKLISSSFVYVAVLALITSVSSAGIHTWDVREVYSNASGTIQFIELYDPTGVNELGVGNGSVSSNTQSHSWTNGPVTGPTSLKSYLIASQSFADLPGAPVPDVIIPPEKLPFFDPTGDTIVFASDSWTFGAITTDGVTSLDRSSGEGQNTPKNYAGTEGTVDANPPPPAGPVPISSTPVMLLMLSLLGLAGFWLLRTRSEAAA